MVEAYRAFHLTATGASHLKNGTVCQDSAQSAERPDCRLLAVGDGHGGADYFRSDRGSRFAVRAFMECAEDPDLIAALSAAATEKAQASRVGQLVKSVIARWNSLVERDILAHPFQKEEWAQASGKAQQRYAAGERLHAAYGTTLIGLLLAEDFWLGIQIGDGRCVTVSADGGFAQPIPWDEECFLNVTTSLCDENAAAEFRFCFGRSLPAAVFIGSDGVDDCFAGEERLYDFYRVVLKSFAEADCDAALSQLAGYLPRLSAKGSGDDMSIGILMNMDLAAENRLLFESGRTAAENEEAL